MRIIRRHPTHPRHVQFGHRLTDVRLPRGLPPYEELVDELLEMTEVLTGHMDSPVESPYLTLMEVAGAYHSRGRQIEMLIYFAEADGTVAKGSQLYKFRTGPLQSFLEASKRAFELGSRRLTQEELLTKMRLESSR